MTAAMAWPAGAGPAVVQAEMHINNFLEASRRWALAGQGRHWHILAGQAKMHIIVLIFSLIFAIILSSLFCIENLDWMLAPLQYSVLDHLILVVVYQLFSKKDFC